MSTQSEIFRPRRSDGRAQWQVVYDLFKGKPVDTIITYDELSAELERDIRESRSAVYKAAEVMEREDQRTLIPERNVGYRIARPSEHEMLGRSHHRRAGKQVRKSVSKFRSADRRGLTNAETARVDSLEITASRHADMLKRLDGRVSRVEAAVKASRRDTSGQLAEQQEQIDRMQEAMKQRGILEQRENEQPAES